MKWLQTYFYFWIYWLTLGDKIKIFIYFFSSSFVFPQSLVLFFFWLKNVLIKFYEYPALKKEFDNCFFWLFLSVVEQKIIHKTPIKYLDDTSFSFGLSHQ